MFFLNMNPLSEVAPGLLVIQIPIQAVWMTIPQNSLFDFENVWELSFIAEINCFAKIWQWKIISLDKNSQKRIIVPSCAKLNLMSFCINPHDLIMSDF